MKSSLYHCTVNCNQNNHLAVKDLGHLLARSDLNSYKNTFKAWILDLCSTWCHIHPFIIY